MVMVIKGRLAVMSTNTWAAVWMAVWEAGVSAWQEFICWCRGKVGYYSSWMGKEEKWVKAENITFLSECDDLDTGHLYSSEVHTLSIQTCTHAQTSGLERAEKREKKKMWWGGGSVLQQEFRDPFLKSYNAFKSFKSFLNGVSVPVQSYTAWREVMQTS